MLVCIILIVNSMLFQFGSYVVTLKLNMSYDLCLPRLIPLLYLTHSWALKNEHKKNLLSIFSFGLTLQLKVVFFRGDPYLKVNYLNFIVTGKTYLLAYSFHCM